MFSITVIAWSIYMRSSDSILLLFLSREEVKHIPFMLWMSSNCLFQLAVVLRSVSVPGMWQVSAAALWELGLETQIHTGWKEATVRMVCSSFVKWSLQLCFVVAKCQMLYFEEFWFEAKWVSISLRLCCLHRAYFLRNHHGDCCCRGVSPARNGILCHVVATGR